MGEFIKTFFQTLGIGTLCMFAILGFGILFESIGFFPSSEEANVVNPVVDSSSADSAESQAVEARIAESIYQSRIDSEPVPEPVSSADVEYTGADGRVITFVQNSSAVNPSYDQVISFLKSDTTDQTPYERGKFTCGDYAEKVQHNAENAGWNCGWVFIELNDGYNHACNVFDTTDRGLVFVDSTTLDSIVDVKTGAEYHPIPLTKLLGYNSGVSADSMGVVKSFTIKW
jgi:hypothetical protein